MVQALQNIIATAEQRNGATQGDYIQEGLLYCHKCHRKKQMFIDLLGNGQTKTVHVMCQCRKEEQEQDEYVSKQREHVKIVKSLKKTGITDPKYLDYTFAKDNGSNPYLREISEKFVSHFREIAKLKVGLLFYGDVGTGKTFFASAIANALLAQGVPVSITNFATVISQLQDLENKHKVIPRLCSQKLVVLDDLGAERNTSFGKEQVFNVIDSLVRADTVVIVTSNLSPQAMKNTTDLTDRRIYDRVLHDLCPKHIPFTGKSKREILAEEKRAAFQKILG